ncbi:unnamed protein product [Lasius platythorax]|uniref:Uncharacterized protein n=1 Tax=Lasius platythorax TaxID=488582 RepID=A0AAV2PAH9_9HYME
MVLGRGVDENARKFPGMLSQVRTDYRIALARKANGAMDKRCLSSGERRDTCRVVIVGRRAPTRIHGK